MSFPAGSGNNSAIDLAISEWDDSEIPASAFGISAGDGADFSPTNHDDVSHITLGAGGDFDDQDCLSNNPMPAFEEARIRGDHFRETDVWLNATCTWDGDGDYYDLFGGARAEGRMFTYQVMLHEIGHVVGLDHELGERVLSDTQWNEDGDILAFADIVDYDGWPATMEPWSTGGAVYDYDLFARTYVVNEDDRMGVRAIYSGANPGGPGIDLAVQSFYVPDDDTVAGSAEGCEIVIGSTRPSPYVDLFDVAIQEDPTDVYGSCPDSVELHAPGDPWPVLTPVPDEPLLIAIGAPLDVHWSLTNLGDDDETALFRVMLTDSPSYLDTCPNTHCWIVHESTPTLNRNRPYDKLTTITIPEVPEGTYTLRAMIDADDVLTEVVEWNNEAVFNQELEVVDIGCNCSTANGRPSLAFLALSPLVLLRRRRSGA